MGAGGADCILKRSKVIVPSLPLGIVGFANLPVTIWIFESFGEARELLFLADMQEKLEDRRATEIYGSWGIVFGRATGVSFAEQMLGDPAAIPQHLQTLVERRFASTRYLG